MISYYLFCVVFCFRLSFITFGKDASLVYSIQTSLKTICSVLFFIVQMIEIKCLFLKHSQKSMRLPSIDIELQLVLFEHASLNLWENSYIIVREFTCNKNDEIAYYHALLIFLQFNLTSRRGRMTSPDTSQNIPPKNQKRVKITFFENMFSIYLTTKSMALHMHFKDGLEPNTFLCTNCKICFQNI